jgi:hypothetical protein
MLQLMRPEPLMRVRILVSTAFGLVSGIYCYYLLVHFHQGAGDFRWAVEGARNLLAHQNVYADPQQLYPLPAFFFGLPFVRMSLSAAGATFYGISSTLLAFGLIRQGYYRLLVFLAYPYWAGMLAAQWGPLLMASAFFPLLLPACLAKPQTGIPVALTHLTRRGSAMCMVVCLIAFALMPHWLGAWLGQLGGYQRFYPLLVLPGPLLLLALFRYRDPDAVLLLLTAALPQRWFYDTLILWLIPKTRKEILWTAFLAWGAGVWRWYHTPNSFAQAGRISVIFIYLPMLAVILLRQGSRPESRSRSSR